MTRFVSAFAAVLALIAFAPTSADAKYPTNSCVSGKQKAAGKYCSGVLKAHAKYANDPSKDPGGVARDAAIAKAATKLSSGWVKSEDKATKKGVDCTLATVDSVTASGQIDLFASTLEAAISNGVDNNDSGDRKCRSGILKAASKLCGGFLKADSKHIKGPEKDPLRAKHDASDVKSLDKYVSSYGKAAGTCIAGQADEATVQADVAAATDALRLSTITMPGPAGGFIHVVDGTPGVGEETWGTGTVAYEKLSLTPRCVKDTPYSFHYRKGTENKLLMYYQGGGACWDLPSCLVLNINKQTAGAFDNPDLVGTGFADPTNAANPFKDWHVVFVSYCTGDVHWGEVETLYAGVGGGFIKHFGFMNSRLGEKWARERFVDPDEVFVTGSSAGSYGAIMHSINLMESVYPASPHAVVGDAGTGVITREWLDLRIDNWGIMPNLPDFFGIATAQELSSAEMWIKIAQRFPNHRFAQYQSAYDGGGGGQAAFFNVMKNPVNTGEWVNWEQHTCEWSACMRLFTNDIYDATTGVEDNFRFYTGAGSRHTVWGSDKVYTDTTDGVPVLVDWLNDMRAGAINWVNVDCADGGDCNLISTCQGGTNAGGTCTSGVDCPGGSCEGDPDSSSAPYNNDGTVTCAPTVCPCGPDPEHVVCAP
jgi:hypothetical protein